MMQLDEIRKFYPAALQHQGAFMLREYLQCKVLEMIFNSAYADRFAFMGGTCLRIMHRNERFSEDLDFDNFQLTEHDFDQVAALIKQALEAEGYQIEMRNVIRGAFHCYIRFPGILYAQGLSGHKEARILINLDTQPQHVDFEPELLFINQFDVFSGIRCTPLDMLLSQKIYAICNRKQAKGRDFFDTVFLLGKVQPNYAYLSQKIQIDAPESLRQHLLQVCQSLDFQALAEDVSPFLFSSKDAARVLQFPEFIKHARL
jgi:predicted nucleotidyltransferase component of viral defense system